MKKKYEVVDTQDFAMSWKYSIEMCENTGVTSTTEKPNSNQVVYKKKNPWDFSFIKSEWIFIPCHITVLNLYSPFQSV